MDADGNGLYDDTERKAMLEEFLKASPELPQVVEANSVAVVKAQTDNPLDFQEGGGKAGEAAATPGGKEIFDMDGDGRVTIEEQSKGRPPLSMIMPPSFLQSGVRIPWGLDVFPEWIATAYFQEDVAEGAVGQQTTRGTVKGDAAQTDAALQPRKSGERGGVEFAANSGQHLVMPGQRDARWNYRWCILTFRIDGSTGTDRRTVLLDINKGNGSSLSSPKIWYDKDAGLGVQYVGTNKGGLDRRIMTGRNVVADGKTWNVLVCGIRYGQMHASLNGVPMASETKQPPRFSGEWPTVKESYLGDASKGNMAWACDALVFGLSEPSEAMVRKMTGWAAHRLGFQSHLPEGHPYRVDGPVVDAEDFPSRYVHDDAKWTAWGAATKDKSITRVNAGGPRVEPQGFEQVFIDDFRADRVKASTSGEGDLWVGPGYNIAVGGKVPLATPGKEPNAYPYDAANRKQILSIVSTPNGRWLASSFYSVNDMGWGHTWKGPKIFRIRCMFPKTEQKDLAGVLWPAFWSYGVEHLFWRTTNRIENDYFELDGSSGGWLNGLSTHLHYPYLKGNLFAKNGGSYQRYKVYGGDLNNPEKSRIEGGFFAWDGQFHTWEYVFDKDMTYINISIPQPDGQEKWVEVCRVPTAPTYLEREDLQLSYAVKEKGSMPRPGERPDFVVESVEVLQKTSQVEAAPEAPFTARPEISGSVTEGSAITCQPHLDGITDVRYYWFADNYPLTYGPDNTYTVTAADAGRKIRCLVKAVGARDMPEAWSNALN